MEKMRWLASRQYYTLERGMARQVLFLGFKLNILGTQYRLCQSSFLP